MTNTLEHFPDFGRFPKPVFLCYLEAVKRGFSYHNPEWANLGQGARGRAFGSDDVAFEPIVLLTRALIAMSTRRLRACTNYEAPLPIFITNFFGAGSDHSTPQRMLRSRAAVAWD